VPLKAVEYSSILLPLKDRAKFSRRYATNCFFTIDPGLKRPR
jgi:hypothetical protein